MTNSISEATEQPQVSIDVYLDNPRAQSISHHETLHRVQRGVAKKGSASTTAIMLFKDSSVTQQKMTPEYPPKVRVEERFFLALVEWLDCYARG